MDYTDRHNSRGLALLCTRKSKLQTFQFKFLHRRIATMYQQLHVFIQNCYHAHLINFAVSVKNAWKLFYICSGNVLFWNGIKQWMSKRPCFPNNVFPFQSCLGFVDNASNILSHHFLLIFKYHIHWSKLRRLFPSPALCIEFPYLPRSGEMLRFMLFKMEI